MIGDRESDIQAGLNAGVVSILVLTGAGRETVAKQAAKPAHVAENITDAVAWILRQDS